MNMQSGPGDIAVVERCHNKMLPSRRNTSETNLNLKKSLANFTLNSPFKDEEGEVKILF